MKLFLHDRRLNTQETSRDRLPKTRASRDSNLGITTRVEMQRPPARPGPKPSRSCPRATSPGPAGGGQIGLLGCIRRQKGPLSGQQMFQPVHGPLVMLDDNRKSLHPCLRE